ncbi:MAG: copper homeostasis protein CutC [Saprospiraceae bacterium]
MKKIIREACVTTLEQAIQAEKDGADQLELCEHIEWDGITPSEELLSAVLEKVSIPVKVLLRPRKGNFVYDAKDMEMVIAEIEMCKKHPIAGIVTGMLREDNQFNFKQLREVLEVAGDLPVFIHKAIDVTPDSVAATQQLREQLPAIAGILTSGGALRAEEALPRLAQLLAFEQEDFEVFIAGKVTPENIEQIQEHLNGRHYHGRWIV